MSDMTWPKDLKKTRVRQAILKVLRRADSPLSALQIAAQILKEDAEVWPSTLYRGLEAFVKGGIIKRIDLAENSASLYELETHEHGHYAICLDCRRIIKIANCPFDSYEPLIDDANFAITSHKMEIYGYCSDCLKKRMPAEEKDL